jgi:hypothetical protein
MEERPRGRVRKRATTLIHDEHIFCGLRQNSEQVRDFDLRDTACGEGPIRCERYLVTTVPWRESDEFTPNIVSKQRKTAVANRYFGICAQAASAMRNTWILVCRCVQKLGQENGIWSWVAVCCYFMNCSRHTRGGHMPSAENSWNRNEGVLTDSYGLHKQRRLIWRLHHRNGRKGRIRVNLELLCCWLDSIGPLALANGARADRHQLRELSDCTLWDTSKSTHSQAQPAAYTQTQNKGTVPCMSRHTEQKDTHLQDSAVWTRTPPRQRNKCRLSRKAWGTCQIDLSSAMHIWESMEMNPNQIKKQKYYVFVICAGLTYFSVLFQWPVPVVADAKLLLNCLYEFSVSRPQFDSSISPSVCHSWMSNVREAHKIYTCTGREFGGV